MSDSSMRISDMPEVLTPTGQEMVPIAYNGKNLSVEAKAIAALATATTVGLDKVDNTPDTDKPISTDQQAALDRLDGKINVRITRADW